MEMQKVKITPALAAEWLDERNNQNRKLTAHTVDKYARDLSSGHWPETHQNAIGFYADGVLADGQHRLSAIVKAGISLDMWVATGISRDAGAMIDQGRSRTIADGMRIGGVLHNEKWITAQVAIVNLIRRVETGKQGLLTLTEASELIGEAQDAIDFVLDQFTNPPRKIGSAPVRAALVTAYANLPQEMVASIARVLVSGMPESKDDETIIRLRNWIIMANIGGEASRNTAYRTCLRMFHARQRGENIKSIRPPESLYMKSGLFNDQ